MLQMTNKQTDVTVAHTALCSRHTGMKVNEVKLFSCSCWLVYCCTLFSVQQLKSCWNIHSSRKHARRRTWLSWLIATSGGEQTAALMTQIVTMMMICKWWLLCLIDSFLSSASDVKYHICDTQLENIFYQYDQTTEDTRHIWQGVCITFENLHDFFLTKYVLDCGGLIVVHGHVDCSENSMLPYGPHHT